MAAFTTCRRVEFRDTDAAGIVHFSAFFLWMESAEHELLRQAGVRVVERSDAAAAPGGGSGTAGSVVSWPRVSASCDYVASVRFGDEIEITVTVADIGRSSVTYAFAFALAGQPVAAGRVVAVRCLMLPGQRPEPVPIPADIAALLERYRAA
jgi:acyl-CoA thioester hydrolase